MSKRTAYLAAEGFEPQLLEELQDVEETHGRLVIAKGAPQPAFWAQNIWYDPVEMEIASIKDGAKKLRAIQRNWSSYSFDFHRRSLHITESLPHVSAKPLNFPSAIPTAPLGAFMLTAPDKMLVAPRTSSAFPNGEVHFIEDKDVPPNRAYLKLWEAFTLIQQFPGKDDVCVDLGSSPGGWTWVLAKFGAKKVISVDKAELAPHIAEMKNVEFRQESAFAIKPETLGPVDWMCCDIACYPERLLRLVQEWLKAGTCKNFICTLKFQGETDHKTAKAFAAIPGSRLIHLSCNKHELTWIKLA